MSCSMILLDGVAKRFGDVAAVRDANLCVERGEFVALLGPSGCGKTTLLRLIAGFENPDAATIRARGTPVAGAGLGAARAAARRHGLPGLRALPAPHGGRERRLRAAAPRARARACPSCSRSSASAASAAATRTSSRAASSSASRSPGRSRPPPSRPARRALVERRPAPASGAARRARAHPPAARRHRSPRHARP